MGAGAAMSQGLAVRVLMEHARRKRRRQALNLLQLTKPGPQRDFILDEAPFVAASCGRQAGKTRGILLKMLMTARKYPHAPCLYLANTRPQARSIIWAPLREMDTVLRLGGKFNETRLLYTLPNGGSIQLGGANDAVEIERYRGPQYPLVALDELQSFRSFASYLIYQVLRPGQIKYGKAAQIIGTGTPNASRSGLLYDIATGVEEGWSVHHWTVFDNPYIPDPEAFVADILKRRKLSEKDAAAQREYWGQWVRDASSLVYKVKPANLVSSLPEANDWQHVIGIDFGYANVTAFAVLAYSVSLGRIVLVESFQERVVDTEDESSTNAIVPPRVAEILRTLLKRYPKTTSVVGDPGAMGAEWIEQLRLRYSIAITAAEKQQKRAAVELLNGDLRTEKMLIVEGANEDLLHDAGNLEYLWEKVDARQHGGNVSRFDLLIDTRIPDHLTDAWTYAYRECWHFLELGVADAARNPPPGTPEHEVWEDEQRDREELDAEESDWLTGGGEMDGGFSGFGLG